MKFNKIVGVVSAVMLSSCGEGGPDATSPIVTAPAATPTPTVTPTPTATPTPTSSNAATLLTLSPGTQVQGFQGSNAYYRDASYTVTYAQDLSIGAGFPVYVGSTAGSFVITSSQSVIPSGGSALVSLRADYSNPVPGYLKATGQDGATKYTYQQLVIGPSNPVLPLTYSSVSIVRASYQDTASNITKYAVSPAAWGTPFDYSTVKLTGSATYNGVVLAHARGTGSTHVYDITGTAQISMNYDSTAFTGTIALTATDDVTGATFGLGTINLQSNPPRGSLDYFYSTTTSGDLFQGRLAGNSGQEFIAGFDAHIADPQTPNVLMKISGALAARK
jgi:hypothetical protein